MIPLPPRNGVHASSLQLPPGAWATLLDALCAHFAMVPRETWLERIDRGLVFDERGAPITPSTPYRVGFSVRYYREVMDEPRIPFVEGLVHVGEHFVVADKPHFLPVTPSGPYVEETLLARLVRRLDNPHLVPLHRIDRATAGLVLFSTQPATRARYQALFPERRIDKHYEALAAALPGEIFPKVHMSRLERGEPFFRMHEVTGAPNAESRIEVLERAGNIWRYALQPVTGKKHQLRVHMAALGAGIVNDAWYPTLDTVDGASQADDVRRPMKLLAKRLRFIDPMNGSECVFESSLEL